MAGQILISAMWITNNYLLKNYSNSELKVIWNEINEMIQGIPESFESVSRMYSYEEVQDVLSSLNEKESIRKNKGVYYTPKDIVRFILTNSVKLVCGKLEHNNLHVMDLDGITYSTFCYEKSVYDPTCGAGVFLVEALEMKFDLLDLQHTEVSKKELQKVVASINGNDLNSDSIAITKIRLFLCALHRYGVEKSKGLGKIMNKGFMSYDFVTQKPNSKQKYDIIIGNPPYVEDSKSVSSSEKKYGNIYANVLENAAIHLKAGGALGFIVPISYVSTPRMKKIREELYDKIPEQYILSYSDRPDCLFTSVHQKLCVLFGRNRDVTRRIYTGNYRYWYREERDDLFNTAEVVENDYAQTEYIPKLGTKLDTSIYRKVIRNKVSIINYLERGKENIYLNMRAAFWIKAFLNEHTGSEYKRFNCESNEEKHFVMCLLNSSLFWWYWICVSDCWHITRKELIGFKVPDISDFSQANILAIALENKMEDTKLYVGTKQTEYEYKHKECLDEIHRIDDYINNLYGLSDDESLYIKNFAYRYRIGGGVTNESN